MKVKFRHFGPNLASSRYRAIMPAQWLKAEGIEEGKDWLVIGKHGWSWDRETSGYAHVCFDICDDHFDGQFSEHYRDGARKADLVTCNSAEMRRVILEKTGRNACVIPDPYEQREEEPRISDSLLWFGHASNLRDLSPWLERVGPLEIVTNLDRANGVTPWSPETMDRAFSRAGLVLIPTGKSMAKSGNRAVESLRRGLFVVAGYLPAYADLGIFIGDIGDGIDWALSHREEALRRVKESQRYIAQEYGMDRIGRLWKQTLSS
jgi:hypothetical protein